MLSRNTSVAFVVGAAGFIGSHVVEKLLEKGVQVVGLDDLSSGTKDNLVEATKSKHFHFVNQCAREKILLGFPRLDYAYFLVSDEISSDNYQEAFANFLEICKKYKSKIILISSVELYDLKKEGFSNLRQAEKKLAKFAEEFKLNARVVRVAGIYGPRMHFQGDDPIARLIYASASGQLQKEMAPLDFTTRCLYVGDVVDLLIKAVMHGSTSQKIYDGALLHPIKVSEIRQVLLDPLWHESRGFEPTELPPWPSPNLIKTQRELSWKASTPVVVALRKTISYFKDNPDLLQKQTPVRETGEKRTESTEKTFSRSTLSDYRSGEEVAKKEPKEEKISYSHREKETSFSQSKQEFWQGVTKLTVTSLIVAMVVVGLVYPAMSVVIGIMTTSSSLINTAKAVEAGDYQQADKEIVQAKKGVALVNETVEPFLVLGRINWLGDEAATVKDLLQSLNLIVAGTESEAAGIKSLHQVLRVVAGEEGNLKQLLEVGSFNLSEGDRYFSLAKVNLGKLLLQSTIPNFFKQPLSELSIKVSQYQKIAAENRSLVSVLPQLLAIDGQKNYFILLQDNSRLRPSGGVGDSYAGITFKQGKIVDINSGNLDKLDKQIKSKVTPPTELRKDAGSLVWQMKDVGFDPDFPTSAKWALWFYESATGVDAQAVVALDYSAVIRLLEATGPITLPITHEKVDSTNFYDKAKNDKDGIFAAQALKELLSKLFYVPNQDWPEIMETTNKLFDEKHAVVFSSDPMMLAYINSQNWSGAVSRQPKEEIGKKEDFLAISEANMGNLRLNLNLKRSINLQSSIDDNGIFSRKLIIDYSNDEEEADTAGIYKNRLRIYLPAGTRLNKGSWGGQDITKDISAFTDYGRAGYSMLLNLQPKETKSLVVEYADSKPVKADNGGISYRLNIIKQPGTGSDPLAFKFNYPASFKAKSLGDQKIPQEVSFATDLSEDRKFEITLQK